MKKDNHICISGARERNLKDVTVAIPRDQLVVVSGLSGSGKSSLVFDTIHQEGQRRFLESLSAYARQFLGQMKRPDVDSVEGLSPTLCIDQKTVNRNPRSTVGTITEISGYLRLLLARLGTPHCPECHQPLIAQTPLSLTQKLLSQHANKRVEIFAPIVLDRKGEYRKELLQARRDGYTYARIDGDIMSLSDEIDLARYEKHRIELRIDRTKLLEKNLRRIQGSIEKALILSNGLLSVTTNGEYQLISSKRACPVHGHTAPELEPRLFSFNDPQGQCRHCLGLGYVEEFDFDAMFAHDSKMQTSFIPFGEDDRLPFSHLDQHMWPLLLDQIGIDRNKKWHDLTDTERHTLLIGKDVPYTFQTLDGRLVTKKRWRGLQHICRMTLKYAPNTRLSKYRSKQICPQCQGKRLNPVALAVRFQNRNIHEFSTEDIGSLYAFFTSLELGDNQQLVGGPILRQLLHRLAFLVQVGLNYLSLDRSAVTLSGGESQRIRLAAQVGSGLQGVTYILDEPSIGLHYRDQLKLLGVLENLRDKGNSVLVVEHDPLTMSKADYCIEVGPGAGTSGGQVVASTSRKRFVKGKTLTATYLRGDKGLQVPATRRTLTKHLILKGASGNNLKDLSVSIPLHGLVVVTGVSGSGKSTLIQDTLCAIIGKQLHQSQQVPLPYADIEGLEQLDKLININQKPIGRSSRSNPATYTKVWDDIRQLFAKSQEAKRRGYRPSRFSFNVDPVRGGGRCEDCDGCGTKLIEMQFLEDVEVECESCNGQRFNDETLQIRYNGKNIYEVLELTIEEALTFFKHQPRIKKILTVLNDIGLGYIKLGQPSTTLSGGEAQRIKLGTELRKRSKGHTLYVLDEPSTGLHMADVERLVHSLNTLVEQGHSVVVIEHDLDIIKMADHLIDLGPDGGCNGGMIVGEGTPEQVSNHNTPTGMALRETLQSTNRDHLQPRLTAKYTRKVKHRDIVVKNALTHNLKNIDVTIPKGKMTVVTGPSGSGKSSLAFHTIFAEGQLRYIESLSTYARRFLGRMKRPPVDEIQGLAPAIAIDQSNRGKSSRSTVATSTEIYDILRILFARIGRPHCSICSIPLFAHSPTSATMALKSVDEKGLLLSPYPYNISVEHLLNDGIVRIWKDNAQLKLDTLPPNTELQSPLLIVDRFTPTKVSRQRLASAFDTAYSFGQDVAHFQPIDLTRERRSFTRDHRCLTHNKIVPNKLSPRLFSFNTKVGACPTCDGLGKYQTIQWNKLFLDPKAGFWESMHGWATVSFKMSRKFLKSLNHLFSQQGVSLSDPVETYPNGFKQLLMHGSENIDNWEGLVARINRWNADTSWLRDSQTCPTCEGMRLNRDALAITIHGRSISEICQDTIDESWEFWNACTWNTSETEIVEQPLKEILSRLQFLREVGLGYLSLDRIAHTLSGGESQRIRLASQLGSTLTRTIYVLDEPTIGLHPYNTNQLLTTLRRLKSYNNTLILVEHDQHVIESADHIIELGPGAGEWGGEIVDVGSLPDITAGESLTGQYLTGRKSVHASTERRTKSEWLTTPPLSLNNIQNQSLSIPRGCLTVVTGVSGSGKSTMVMKGFCNFVDSNIHNLSIEKLTVVDQRPISRSPRSTTASYTGILDKIRSVFVKAVLAKERGYSVGHFSYNVEKGRCAHCEGKGATLIEMHFISDIWVPCPVCKGARYDESILEVTWNSRNIADVLDFSVDEAQVFFSAHKAIQSRLIALQQVGLGYLRLGQPNSELSGGELQRLKLATELAKGKRAKETCFVLDEPTTGLHLNDITTLLKALNHLVDIGHTVVLIEHHVDVWKSADHIIEMGPNAGALGGQIVFSGTPEELSKTKSPTKSQQFLLPNDGVSS